MSDSHTSTPELHAIVLAAGASRRLGRPKQLVELGGQSLVELAVGKVVPLCRHRVWLVLGADHEAIRGQVEQLDCTPVINHRWREGMSSSLRAGIQALPAQCDGALVTLVDQPLVSRAALRALVRVWLEAPERAVASAYGDAAGVPAVLPRRLFPAVQALSGDRGAKSIIAAEGARLRTVPLPDAAFDIDRPADLEKLEHPR